MKSKSSESRIETKLEVRKTEETDKLEKEEDRREKSDGEAKKLRRQYTSGDIFCSNLRRELNIIDRGRRNSVCK